MSRSVRSMPWHVRLQELLQTELHAARQHPVFCAAFEEVVTTWHKVMAHVQGRQFPLDHAQSEALWHSATADIAVHTAAMRRLLEIIPQYAPRLAAMYGSYLAECITRGIWRTAGVEPPPELGPAWGERMERLSPDNPLVITPDDTVAGGEKASLKHFAALRDYYTSLKPARPRGRPKGPGPQSQPSQHLLDPVQAAQAYQMHADGADWKAIAAALSIPYLPHDQRQRGRARSRVMRLIERGRLNTR